MIDFEQQWAVALKKSQQKQRIPLATQKANLTDQIKKKKKELWPALKTKNQSSLQLIFEKLIKLRARLTIINLKIIKEQKYYLTEEMIKQYSMRYAYECHALAKTINKLLRQ